MSKLVFNRDGGKTDEFGHLLALGRWLQGEVIEGLLVTANGTPNMTVNVGAGTGAIPTGSAGTAYKYFIGVDATESVAITTANASNPRNDLIVAYIDKSVTPSQSFTNNSNNMLKIVAVAGNPATTPADPSVAMIQAAIGSASNPYIILARVVVSAGVTQITAGYITDLRSLVKAPRVAANSVGAAQIIDGSIGTAELANNIITAQKIALSASGAFSAYDNRSNSTSISASVFTRVDFNTELFDVNSWYDTVNSRFTPQVEGYYQLNAFVGLLSSADNGTVHIVIRKNGANLHWTRIRPAGGGEVGGLVSCIVYANGTTDYFDVAAFCSVATQVGGSQQNHWFNGARV